MFPQATEALLHNPLGLNKPELTPRTKLQKAKGIGAQYPWVQRLGPT